MATFEQVLPCTPPLRAEKEDLVVLMTKCQERTFSEDIDFIESHGG